MKHCWQDKQSWIEREYGSLSPEMMASLFKPSATCLLADGHKEPHEWTDDSEIEVQFK